MSTADKSVLNTDAINHLNTGLILLSCAIAFFLPFELFLFSYAVLGPAHYLTEISWLSERRYFLSGKRDWIFFAVAGVLLFLLNYVVPHLKWFDEMTQDRLASGVVFASFAFALALVVLKDGVGRTAAFFAACAGGMFFRDTALLLSIFLPTLIHVFVFTGLFMLYGAMKGRSRSGYFSCLVFAVSPLLLICFAPASTWVTDYALRHYPMFHILNLNALGLFVPEVLKSFKSATDAVYQSAAGLALMRVIAFSYTYHYLNWFSKTRIIRWHEIPKARLWLIVGLWLASLACYAYDYKVGFHVLFLLSMLHVFLEFPLNHVSIIGIFREARLMLQKAPTLP